MQHEHSHPIWRRALTPLCDGGLPLLWNQNLYVAADLDPPCLNTKSCRGTISSASISSSPCGIGAGGRGAVVTSVSFAWGLEESVDNVLISVGPLAVVLASRGGAFCVVHECVCVCVCVCATWVCYPYISASHNGGCHQGKIATLMCSLQIKQTILC